MPHKHKTHRTLTAHDVAEILIGEGWTFDEPAADVYDAVEEILFDAIPAHLREANGGDGREEEIVSRKADRITAELLA